MSYEITSIGGNCPVQAEGTIDGMPFYFRARGEHWSFSVADTPDGPPVEGKGFYYEEDYGDEPYAAGWMPESEAYVFIEKAAKLYRTRNHASVPTKQKGDSKAMTDYGTATGEEIAAGVKLATALAKQIKALPNPAVQNMVKEMIAMITVQPQGLLCVHCSRGELDHSAQGNHCPNPLWGKVAKATRFQATTYQRQSVL